MRDMGLGYHGRVGRFRAEGAIDKKSPCYWGHVTASRSSGGISATAGWHNPRTQTAIDVPSRGGEGCERAPAISDQVSPQLDRSGVADGEDVRENIWRYPRGCVE